MPARTDHERRDAQDAAYATIGLHIKPYIRRMVEHARAIIEQEAAANDGSKPVEWTSVGEAAAYSALLHYGVDLPARKVAVIADALTAAPDPAQLPPGPRL